MKKLPLFSLVVLSSLTLASAAPKNDTAPTSDKHADALAAKINDAIKSKAVSQQDGDELLRSLARVQKKDAEAQRTGRMNKQTLKTDNMELDRLEKNLTRKEKEQTAAMAAASPSASP